MKEIKRDNKVRSGSVFKKEKFKLLRLRRKRRVMRCAVIGIIMGVQSIELTRKGARCTE